jgi:hypothetical protein
MRHAMPEFSRDVKPDNDRWCLAGKAGASSGCHFQLFVAFAHGW